MEKTEKKQKYVISRGFDSFFVKIFDAWRFMLRFFSELLKPPLEWDEIVKQCYQVGYRSLGLISLTGFITGLVFTKQSRPSLSDFGAASWLPSLVAIAIIRALAPLVTSLICAGKVGSNIGAELGSMEVSATNPYKFLVVSRVLATTVMIPVLTCYSAFIGLMGSFLDVHAHEKTSLTTFFENAFSKITFLDIGATLVKAICYGFTIGIVSCYKGYHASQGTEGVGRAANSSVVLSMFFIFIEEIVIVQITNYLRT
jgi:phospholipid/cholesterol/gamma-HCH transport system permease protein